MVIDRNSNSYLLGRFIGKGIIFVVGLFVVRKYFQKPMDKSFPEIILKEDNSWAGLKMSHHCANGE